MQRRRTGAGEYAESALQIDRLQEGRRPNAIGGATDAVCGRINYRQFLPIAPRITALGASRPYAYGKPDSTEILLVMTSNTIHLVACVLTLAIQPQIARSQQTRDLPIHGSVLRLDSASHVELTNTTELLQQQTPFTVEMWVRAQVGKQGTFPLLGDFVDHKHPSVRHPDRAGWLLGVGRTTGGALSFNARFPGFEIGVPLRDSEGKWCHIAAANAPDGLSIYINGRRRGEHNPGDKIKWKTSPINLHLGTTMYSPAIRGHQVDVGDLRISSTCLYTDEFNPPVKFEKRPDTLVLLDFSHPGDKQITDLSGREHHGTIRGATWIFRDADSVSMPVHEVIIEGPLGIRRTSAGFVPRFKRWEIKFAAPNSQIYARQLDFFRIELGVIGTDEKNLAYASNLSKRTPTTRNAPREHEKRLYVIQNEADLQKLNQQLLHNSGIETSARTVMHFFPPALENQFAAIELEYGKKQHRTLQEIVKTVFEIKPRGEGWRMEVVEMRFRPSQN